MSADKHRPEWKQDRFYLSTFEAIRDGRGDFRKLLAATKEAGIDLVELVFKDRPLVSRILDVCEELDVRTIVQDPAFGGIGDRMAVPDAVTVEEAVAYYSRYKNIYGFYLWDEPVSDAFGHCRNTRELFEKAAPGKLLFFTAFPSYGVYNWDSTPYNWEENTYVKYIDDFLSVIDPPVLSFDYYPYRDRSMTLEDSDLWRDMGYIARKARETGKPFWFYFQGVDLQTGTDALEREKLTAQMFAAIAYGAKALSWFVTADVLTDLEGEKKPGFETLKGANREAKNLGSYFFDKTPRRISHTPANPDRDRLYFTESLHDSEVLSEAPDGCIVSEFDESGGRVSLLIVNKRDDRPAEGPVRLKTPWKRTAAYDKIAGRIVPDAEPDGAVVRIGPGDAAVLILEKA